jgi:hypothetical protein
MTASNLDATLNEDEEIESNAQPMSKRQKSSQANAREKEYCYIMQSVIDSIVRVLSKDTTF